MGYRELCGERGSERSDKAAGLDNLTDPNGGQDIRFAA
jgi:hypothetical protein